MYTLKSIAQRGTTLGAAMALALGAVIPAILPATTAYADALNPLTERSLALSSSSPGWSFKDGSNNSTYAPPNSGANGKQTGNTYSFKVSSAANVKAMTFQYCKSPAGNCLAPGDNGWIDGSSVVRNDAAPTAGSAPFTRQADSTTTSDLNVVTSSPTEIGASTAVTGTVTVTNNSTAVVGSGTNFSSDLSVGDWISTPGQKSYKVASITDATNLVLTKKATATETGVAVTKGDFANIVNTSTGVVKAVPGYAGYDNGKYGANHEDGIGGDGVDVAGNFVVYYLDAGVWKYSGGWTMTASNSETGTVSAATATGKNNMITIKNSTGQAFTAGQAVKVVFFGTTNNYITNPGSKEFFVRMNTYNSDTTQDNTTVIDGGVTVANVMNQSIWIQTKVLETMSFSVGTVDPYTLDSSGGEFLTATGNATHGVCDAVVGNMNTSLPYNVLNLGDPNADNSLRVDTTYYTHSFWRLSSNSSAGATVYYSGHTLTNTVGDQIEAIGPTKTTPSKGAEQFGLGLVTATEPGTDAASLATSYAFINTANDVETGNDTGKTAVHASVATDIGGNASYHAPTLYPLLPDSNYDEGTTKFAFVPTSDTVPIPLASESNQVVDCVTAKVRYMANIRATTPAGIYTTKVNYIAAPQY